MLLFQQMLALFIFLLIGYYMRKKDILTPDGSRAISWLVVNIAAPCMIVSGALGDSDPISIQMLTHTVILCIFAYIGLIGASLLLPTLLRIPKELHSIYQIMTIFTNIGFMGFPLLRAMYGPGSLVYASIGTVFYNLLFYTYGIRTIQKGSPHRVPFRMTNIINPGTLACLIALACAFLRPAVPTFVQTTVENLGALPASLAMIVIGASMGSVNFLDAFRRGELYLASAVRLLLIPLLTWLLLRPLGLDPVLLMTMVIVAACPAAVLVTVLSIQYGRDSVYTAEGTLQSTVLSMLTIPLLVWLLG